MVKMSRMSVLIFLVEWVFVGLLYPVGVTTTSLKGGNSYLYRDTKKEIDGPLCGEEEKGFHGYVNDLFYVFYEARQDAKDKPLMLWLSGGPGCSGLIGLFFENGPCLINQKSSKPFFNKYAWTVAANVIYIDQPSGTGFSPEEKINGQDNLYNWKESSLVDALIEFMKGWYVLYPDYAERALYIFGESYAGHYIPDMAKRMILQKPAFLKNLRGIGVGNGVTAPEYYIPTMPNQAYQNSYRPILSQHTTEQLNRLTSLCKKGIKKCELKNNCSAVEPCNFISSVVLNEARRQRINIYDVRKPCYDDPSNLCFKFRYLEEYMNSDTFFHALQLFRAPSTHWSVCSDKVIEGKRIQDSFHYSDYDVPSILDHNIRVLIYAGDADLVCNHIGQEEWTQALVWKGKLGFDNQAMSPWYLNGQEKGLFRTYAGLSYVRFYDAGHMVPHDQPQASLEMVQTFLANKFETLQTLDRKRA